MAGHIGTRVVRILLFALILVSLRLQVWFLSMPLAGNSTYGQRGVFVPVILVVVLLGALGMTFIRRLKPSRSEAFMARVRRLHEPKKHRAAGPLLDFFAVGLLVGLFFWSVFV